MRSILSAEDFASALAEERTLIYFFADWSSYTVKGRGMFEELELSCARDLRASFWVADVSAIEAPAASSIADWLQMQGIKKDVNIHLSAACGNGPLVWLKRGAVVDAVYAAHHHDLRVLCNRTEAAFRQSAV